MSINFKKLIALLLALIIVCLIPLSASAQSTEIIIPTNYLTLYESAGPNVEVLDSYVDIDEFRTYLINGFSTCPQSLDISKFKIPYTNASFNAISSYVYYETPETFHIVGMGGSTSGGYIKTLAPSYRFTASDYKTMMSDFYKGANTLLKGIKGNNSLSDVEKALLLHDRLAVWCEYDYANLQAQTLPEASYTAYGVFAKKTAVCMGYALAYDYLLLQVGIDSYYCNSNSLNHAWNVVYVNNSKYHVDVTWDDPVWDKTGQVKHTNFLRSTAGIKATGHNATDFNTAPTDTTFDNYYWQTSETAFQLVNNDIYYIDNSAATLNKISNGVTTTCRSVNAKWMAGAYSYWSGNYSRLACDGQKLLFSLPDAVYEYDTETGVSTKVYAPSTTSGSYYSIYGFKFDDCKLVCEFLDTPNYDGNTKKNYTVTQVHHVESDWIVTKAPTPNTTGARQKTCINCDEIIENETIPAIAVSAKTNSSIDYTNCLIFTDNFTCSDVNNLVAASGTTTVSVESAEALYGSGTVVTVFVDGKAVHELTIIVNGDVNGDSVCDVLDVFEAERCATGKKAPDTIEIYAANSAIAEDIDEAAYQNLVNKALSI